MRVALVALLLTIPHSVTAQEPVVKWADYASWLTAAVNPVWGTIEAARGERPGCHLGQLAISAGLGLGTAFTLQHVITSPRPCCSGNGMPSAHATTSMIGLAQPSPARGFSVRLTIGLGSATATGILRPVANRHTPSQAVWGILLGAGAEAAGQLLRCET